MSDATPRVTNNSAAGQFEIRSEQGQSILKYAHRGESLDLVHTEVPEALQQKGYGKALIEAAVQHARDEHLTLIPSCPFVKHYAEQHPELATVFVAPPPHSA